MQINENSYLKPFKFQSQLLRYPVHTHYLEEMRSKGNLSEIMFEARCFDALQHTSKWMAKDEVWKVKPSSEELKQGFAKIQEQIEIKKKREVDEFFITFFNHSLVMMCAVFDIFLIDCVQVISHEKPQILLALGSDADMSLKDFIEAKNYDDFFDSVQSKILKRFEFGGIEDKLKLLMKLGLSSEQMFVFNDEQSTRYPNPEMRLVQIYTDRHSIVHYDRMILSDHQELEPVSDFLSFLVLHLGGFLFKEHFGVKTDLQLMVDGQLTYND